MINFAKHIEALEHEPQWLRDQRATAWQKFFELPMPTPAEEAWRLLDLNRIDLDKLAVSVSMPEKIRHLQDIEAICEHGASHFYWGKQIKQYLEKAAGIVVHSSKAIWLQLDEEAAKQGVICTTMAEALAKHADLIKAVLTNKEDNSELDKFSLLNQAISHAGIFICVPDNVVLTKPLICLNLFGTDSMSKFVLMAGKNSKLSVVNILVGGHEKHSEEHTSTNQFLVNYDLQTHLQSNAHLDYAEIHEFEDEFFVVDHSNYCLEKDSRLFALIAAFGAGQLKNEVRTVLKDRGAECTVNGVILGNKNESFNFNTIDDHSAPDTKSSIDVRVVLKDEAKSIYHGIIEVAKEAQKTNAFQSNKNLLLGDKAHADSIPKLEILADDVKCSHGATVGPVDRNQLFYLMSRGLSASNAEELIVNGFFHQLIADCKIEGISEWLDSLVANKIEHGRLDAGSQLKAEKVPTATLSVSQKKGQPALVK